MLTAFSQSDLVKKATGAGAMAYVTKPYEESKLLPALEVAMGRFAESTICLTMSNVASPNCRKPRNS